MSATGDYIREAREQKGLTLDQVEQATRIPGYYLEILEGGGDDRLVSDRLYMVHFLRTYAEFLEVEVEPLAAQFVREHRRVEARAPAPAERRRSWKPVMAIGLATVLLGGAGVYVVDPELADFGWRDGTRVSTTTSPPAREPAPPPLTAAAPTPRPDDPNSSVLQPEADETTPSEPRLVAPPPAAPADGVGPETAPVAIAVRATPASSTAEPPEEPVPPVEAQARLSTTGEPADAPDTIAADGPETTATAAVDDRGPEQSPPGSSGDEAREPGATEPAAVAVAAAPEPPAPPEADPAATHSLVITAEQKSWLRVWVDDGPYRDMLLEPGETRTVSAQTGFRITFGNAGGVLLTLNGVELPRAGQPGQVVRDFTVPATPQDTPR